MMQYFVCDTETTGVGPEAGVCEVAISEIDENLEVIASYNSLIQPGVPISASASGVHHITEEDVKDAPTLEQFMESSGQPLGGEVCFIAHNAKFDLQFLNPFIGDHKATLCTLRLARRFYPDMENHKLQTLRYALRLDAGDSHRADGDVRACVDLLRHIAAVSGKGPKELVGICDQPMIVKVMPFGKHRGTPLDQLNYGYRKWLLNLPDLDDDLRFSLGLV